MKRIILSIITGVSLMITGQGSRYVVVDSPYKKVKKAKRYERTQHSHQGDKKVVVIKKGR